MFNAGDALPRGVGKIVRTSALGSGICGCILPQKGRLSSHNRRIHVSKRTLTSIYHRFGLVQMGYRHLLSKISICRESRDAFRHLQHTAECFNRRGISEMAEAVSRALASLLLPGPRSARPALRPSLTGPELDVPKQPQAHWRKTISLSLLSSTHRRFFQFARPDFAVLWLGMCASSSNVIARRECPWQLYTSRSTPRPNVRSEFDSSPLPSPT